MNELPKGLPPLPEGAVYLGKSGEFKKPSGGFHGWVLTKINNTWALGFWAGCTSSFHYAAPADSEIARLNGLSDNKPSWDDAPDWAEWLAQDANGEWWWFDGECPSIDSDLGIWWPMSDHSQARKGQKNPNWRETLERRPINESIYPPQAHPNFRCVLVTTQPQPSIVVPPELIDLFEVEQMVELGYRLEIDRHGLRGYKDDE